MSACAKLQDWWPLPPQATLNEAKLQGIIAATAADSSWLVGLPWQ